MAAMRTKPVTRDSAVPTATTALDRTSEVSASVGLEPGSVSPTSSALTYSGRLPGGRRDRERGVLLPRALPAPPVDVPTPPQCQERDRADGEEHAHTAHEGGAHRQLCAAHREAVGGGHRQLHGRPA